MPNSLPEGERLSSSSQRTFTASVAIVVALIGFFLFKANVRTDVHLILGLCILVLSTVPSLAWVKRGRTSLPVFEVLMLTGLNGYALPLLNGHESLIAYSNQDISTAALAVALFQVVAIATYEWTTGSAMKGRFWRDELISKDIGRWLLYGLALNGGYTCLTTFTTLMPMSLEGPLRAVFFGIGLICTFITARRLGAGELSSGERSFFLVMLATQCLTTIATLFLVGAVSTLVLAVIGYVSSSHRVPIFAVLSMLGLLAILHNGKSAMRAKYWETDIAPPGITSLPAFYAEWISHGLEPGDEGDGQKKMTGKLIERTSLFHIMCLVASLSPSPQPYLSGDTYRDIPAQFVPRFFWANKPLGHVSTNRLSVYYGLQTEADTEKTTIGFGLLAEAYANFGFLGLVGIGLLFGVFIKKAQCWASESPMLSGGGLFIVILLAWSLQTEATLSMWLASLYQACIAVLVVPHALRSFLNR
jgi:hypothetical protein